MTVLAKYSKAVTPHPSKSFIKDTLMQVSGQGGRSTVTSRLKCVDSAVHAGLSVRITVP